MGAPGSAGGAAPKEVKVVLLGDAAVGKSSLAQKFVSGHFDPYSQSTIGAAFLNRTVLVDGLPVKFLIWDTAGQEKYRSLAPMYYRGARCAIVAYDITKAVSFDCL